MLNDARDKDESRAGVRRVMRALYPSVTITETNDDGSVAGEATFMPEPEHQGAPGWVHGGLSATVLDFVSAKLARAALSSRVATGTLDLRYRQPVVLDGGPFVVTGSTNAPLGRTVRVNTTITDSAGRTLVEANSLFVAVERPDVDGPNVDGPNVDGPERE